MVFPSCARSIAQSNPGKKVADGKLRVFQFMTWKYMQIHTQDCFISAHLCPNDPRWKEAQTKLSAGFLSIAGSRFRPFWCRNTYLSDLDVLEATQIIHHAIHSLTCFTITTSTVLGNCIPHSTLSRVYSAGRMLSEKVLTRQTQSHDTFYRLRWTDLTGCMPLNWQSDDVCTGLATLWQVDIPKHYLIKTST